MEKIHNQEKTKFFACGDTGMILTSFERIFNII